MNQPKHILVTGGAGYIGSLLTAVLLRSGHRVTVIDNLLFGGESLLTLLSHPNIHFVKADVSEPRALRDSLRRDWPYPDGVIHLAAIVGFPACQAVGKQAAWHYNVDTTRSVFEQSNALGVERLIFASTYSVYGLTKTVEAVDEKSPMIPQSLYAETKIAAEEYLLAQKDTACLPLIFRLATLYGISPRMRFDLIINQFVLEAYTKRELLIYQRGYSRSFVHVRDVVDGILIGLDAPREKINHQIYNLGTDDGNYTKDEIVAFIIKRLPETFIHYKNLTFGGDMRDIRVSFEKVRQELGFQARYTVDDGVREVLHALQTGLIRNPQDERYRNATFIVQ